MHGKQEVASSILAGSSKLILFEKENDKTMKNKLQSLVIIILLLALGVLGGMYYSETKDKDNTIANNNVATDNNITNQVLENKVKNEATNTNKEEEKTNIEIKLVNKITASGFAGA